MAAFAAVCALANAWACDSGSYKQTGLLHQWDAINNDGTGVHNANATVRKDLKGSLDLTLTSKGSWGDKWLNVAGDSAKGTSATESYRTIEIVFRTTVDSYGIVFCSGIGSRWCLYEPSKTKVYFAAGTSTKYLLVGKVTDPPKDFALAAVYDNNNSVTDTYKDGVATSDGTYSESRSTVEGKVMLGGRMTNTDYGWTGRIYAIRLYDHVLTTKSFSSIARSTVHASSASRWGTRWKSVRCRSPTPPNWRSLAMARPMVSRRTPHRMEPHK